MSDKSRYKAHKDIAADSISEFPEHWSVWKLAHAFSQIGSGTTPKSDRAEYYDGGTIPWVNTGDLNDGVLTECGKCITEKAARDHSTLKLYPSGSLLFAMYGATIGKLGLLEFPATVNQACCVFSGKSPIDVRFLFYWFLGERQGILSLATGGGQPNVSQDILRTLRVGCPPLDEQQQIAAFLDYETAKIDALIEKQQQLIALLGEKRQAVISHAVTKGLNPDAPMRDSGIEWLGEVPEHWEISRLKFLLREPMMYGANEAADQANLNEPRFVRITDIDESGSLRPETFRSLPLQTARPYLLRDGDVLLARSGGTVGKSFIYSDTWGEACFAGYLIKARMNQDVCRAKWFYMFCQTPAYWGYVNSSQIQATIQNVSAEKYGNLLVPFPPIAQQDEILADISRKLARLDDASSHAKDMVELLQERRTALISAAVTGKIDVRGWRPPSSEVELEAEPELA